MALFRFNLNVNQ